MLVDIIIPYDKGSGMAITCQNPHNHAGHRQPRPLANTVRGMIMLNNWFYNIYDE